MGEDRQHDAQAAPAGPGLGGRPDPRRRHGLRGEPGAAQPDAGRVADDRGPPVLRRRSRRRSRPTSSSTGSTCPSSSPARGRTSRPGRTSPTCSTSSPGTDKVWFTVTNGAHTDSLEPAILDRWVEFLVDLRRASRAGATADRRRGRGRGRTTGRGTTSVRCRPTVSPNATSLAQAQAMFEADPRLRILFENGARRPRPACRRRASSAASRRGRSRARRPPRGTSAAAARSSTARRAAAGRDAYTYDAGRAHDTTFGGDRRASCGCRCPTGTGGTRGGHAARVRTAPLTTDTVMVGTGSVDLWLKTAAPDTDLQVTISEVRPDGKEVLRAERLAAREQPRARAGRDGAAPVAHEHRRRRRDV